MNLMTRIKSAKNALFGKVVEASLPNGVIDFMSRFGKVPDVSQDALVRKYFGWAYACANVSATRVATTPLRLYASRGKGEGKVKNFSTKAVSKEQHKWLKSRTKGIEHVAGAEDFEELEEHPLLDLLQNVNDQENSFELKELTSIMLDTTGNAYWLVEKDNTGLPTKLFVLRSHYMRIVPDKDKFIRAYRYGYNNAWGVDTRLELMPEDVIHFKYPNPLDPWYGMGPTQAAAYALESQELREKFILATMSNMARPDLIVKYLEGELDPLERQNVEREWNGMFRGSKNAGKVKVTDFRYEIDKIGWNPNELDFNKGEEWILKKICSVFPVPMGLIDSSQISRAPRAGLEGSDLFMAQLNTLPRCTRIEEKLNEQLCPLYDERLFLAFDNPVPKDRVMQNSEDVQKLTTYQTTINEIRERDGLDPVEWGDLPLVTGNVVPLGSQQQQPQIGPDGQPIKPEIGPDGKPVKPEGGTDLFPKKKPGEEGGKKKPEDQVVDAVDGKTKPKPKEIPKEDLKKALGDDLEVEMDGEHVHSTLAGIPVKVRVRNEGGRFDRHDPEKLRTDRETARLLRVGKGGSGSGNFNHEGRPGSVGGSGGGGGEEESKPSGEVASSKEVKSKAESFQKEIDSWDGSAKQAIATSAVLNIAEGKKDTDGFVMMKDGKLAGAVFFEKDPSKDYIKIKDLASNEKGYGTKIMNEVFSRASGMGKGVALVSMSKEASKFYSHMGMTENPTDVFRMTAQEVKAKASNKSEAPEPEDGCFVSSKKDKPIEKGGPGSGNFGHAGIPGQVGGSSSGGSDFGEHREQTGTMKTTGAIPASSLASSLSRHVGGKIPSALSAKIMETVHTVRTSSALAGNERILTHLKEVENGIKNGDAKATVEALNRVEQKDTEQLHKVDGKWSTERSAMHQDYARSVVDKATTVEKPEFIMSGGGPASGKSFVEKSLVNPEVAKNMVVVNADYAKHAVPEYGSPDKPGPFRTEDHVTASVRVHEESSTMSKVAMALAVKEGKNVLLDSTGDGGLHNLEKKLAPVREAGMKITAHYVTVPTDRAVQQAKDRAANPKSESFGRKVPEAYMREAHAEVSRIVPAAIGKGLFDEFHLWDNNVSKGSSPIHVASAEGKNLTIHNQKLWDDFLAKGDESKYD